MKNEMFELLKRNGRPYQVTVAIKGDEIIVLTTQIITNEQYTELRGADAQPEDLVVHKV